MSSIYCNILTSSDEIPVTLFCNLANHFICMYFNFLDKFPGNALKHLEILIWRVLKLMTKRAENFHTSAIN